MKTKKTYAQQILARNEFMKQVSMVNRMFDVDTLQITLNEELGFGYDRIMHITRKWMENQEKYYPAIQPITHVEADWAQEHLDRELKRIIRGKVPLIPFAERYPDLKKIKY
jgi:hypothetical protein